MAEWTKWLRENFDKVLLAGLFVFLCVFVMHMSHDVTDKDNILWAREMTGTVLGGLLGLITGHAMAARTTASSGQNSVTSTTEAK